MRELLGCLLGISPLGEIPAGAINAQGVYLILGVQEGVFTIDRRRLKKTGIFSHNKLNKTNMLWAKILREFRNSGKSTPSIDMSKL